MGKALHLGFLIVAPRDSSGQAYHRTTHWIIFPPFDIFLLPTVDETYRILLPALRGEWPCGLPSVGCRRGFEQGRRLGAGSAAHGPAGVGGVGTIGKENSVAILVKTKVISHYRNVKASP